MVTKIYQFYNVPSILPILQKVVLRLIEHGDVIETQRRYVPPTFLSKLGPCMYLLHRLLHVSYCLAV